MLAVTIESDKRFVGLRPRVLYRLEMAYAIVDDGDRLYQFQRVVFEDLLDRIRSASVKDGDATVAQLVAEFPTVFELFVQPTEAIESSYEKEV